MCGGGFGWIFHSKRKSPLNDYAEEIRRLTLRPKSWRCWTAVWKLHRNTLSITEESRRARFRSKTRQYQVMKRDCAYGVEKQSCAGSWRLWTWVIRPCRPCPGCEFCKKLRSFWRVQCLRSNARCGRSRHPYVVAHSVVFHSECGDQPNN